MPAKTYAVIVTFPSAPAGLAQQEYRIPASSSAVAVKRAIEQATWTIKRKCRHKQLSEVGRVSWQLVQLTTTESNQPIAEEQATNGQA